MTICVAAAKFTALFAKRGQHEMSNDWIMWDGIGACPVAETTTVQVMRRCETLDAYDASSDEAGSLMWGHDNGAHDIVAYRVVAEQPAWRKLVTGEGWVEWHGGECPVSGAVEVLFRAASVTFTVTGGAALRWTRAGEAGDIVAYRVVGAPAAAGIGDIASAAKGSGARYNSGKPDLSLIPLRLIAETQNDFMAPASKALSALGTFQSTHDTFNLVEALDALGFEAGWAECAQVFDYGRRKYAAWNWAKGMAWSVPLACAARHLLAMNRGEDLDPESGLPHRGHVFCNVVMLLEFSETYREGNDLPTVGLLAA